MDYSITAKQLIEKLGGEKNITSMTHCMTRIRFVLKNESVVDSKEIEHIPGVMGTMKKSGQYQVIIGNNVAKCFKEIQAIAQISEGVNSKKEKQKLLDIVLDFISACMTPMIPAIIAGGLVKVLLVIFGPTLLGWISNTSDTYIIFNALGDSAFYFMPVVIALNASKKLGCNSYLSIMVASTLIYPNLMTLLGGDAPTYLFGVIPVIHGNYASSVIPAMLSTILLKYVEIIVDRITPIWAKNFLKPLLIIIIVAPITLCLIAPLGLIVGDGLQVAINSIYGFAPWLAMALVAGFMPFLVMTGMHWAFLPATLMSLANPGFDVLLIPAMLCSNLAQGGATLAVAMKSKDSKMKQIAFPAAISAFLGGITEPAMYGVTLKLKKPMYAAVIASAVSGVMCGIITLKACAMTTPSIPALVGFVDANDNMNIVYACAIAAISIILSFVFTIVLSKKELAGTQEEVIEEGTAAVENEADKFEDFTVETPVVGKVIALSEVNDATFSSGVLGKGYAVIPSKGEIYAPFDGKVEVLLDTHHAIGLESSGGIVVLVHVGLETVELNGQYFEPQVKAGDFIKKGDVLLKFDLDEIVKAGYDITTPVIVTNPDDYNMDIKLSINAAKGTEVITLKKGE